MTNSFEKLGVDAKLLEGLKKQGISEPTGIQVKAIPLALENKDIIAQAQTGSGKTLAYLLPIFEKIHSDKREMQAIILAPTHELVMQINNQIKQLADNSGVPVTSAAIIGEVNIKRQIEKLKEKPHIIVGSPGRVLELIEKKKIKAHTAKTVVIDEGDRLLDVNNGASVKNIIKATLKERQVMTFSATINEKTKNAAEELMDTPEFITVTEERLVNPNIVHMYFMVEHRERIETLRKLVASIKPSRAIVFINKSEEVELTTLKLQHHHIKAYSIYGNVPKSERKKALDDFRSGRIQLLIASDIAARGLDVEGVTHIFNLDLPREPKEYLHRIGRTGRIGKSGTAISIVTKRDLALLRKYEKHLAIKIEPKKMFKGKIIDLSSDGKSKSRY